MAGWVQKELGLRLTQFQTGFELGVGLSLAKMQYQSKLLTSISQTRTETVRKLSWIIPYLS